MLMKCPICNRSFHVQYPELWVYKRYIDGHLRTLCSWKCLRAYEKEKEETELKGNQKITLEQKKKAIQMALDGKDPLKYLDQLGSSNPSAMWYTIRQTVKEKDPALYERLSKKAETKVTEVTKVTEETTPETEETEEDFTPEDTEPEPPAKVTQMRITKPLVYEGMTVCAVSSEIGTYSYDKAHGYIDFSCVDGEELSFTVDVWRDFIRELQLAALIMGVEL